MKSADARIENSNCHQTQARLAAADITVLIHNDGLSVFDSPAIFLDEQMVWSASNPGSAADGNRNVPPERDVETAMLSLAELCGSIQLKWSAMQPHNGPIHLARITHVC